MRGQGAVGSSQNGRQAKIDNRQGVGSAGARLEAALGAGRSTADDAWAADAARRLAERAGEEGLADLTYAEIDSPVGPLLAVRSRRGLMRLAYVDHNGRDAVLAALAAKVSPRMVEAPRTLEVVRRELAEYFEGTRTAFDLPVDLGLVSAFGRRVLAACGRIPFGGLATYRDMAAGAGNPAAVRAAGTALGRNPVPIVVPCHRVLRTGGGLGGYTGGLGIKQHLLGLEAAEPRTRQ